MANEDENEIKTTKAGEALSTRPVPELVKHTSWSALGSAAASLGTFGALVIAARILGPDGAGRVAYFVWMANISLTFCMLGLPNTLMRFVAELRGSGADRDIEACYRWCHIRFAVSLAAGAVVVLIWARFIESDVSLFEAIFVGLLVILQGAMVFRISWFSGWQRFDIVARIRLAVGITKIAGIILLTWAYGAAGAVLGYAISNLATFMFRKSVRIDTGNHNEAAGLSVEFRTRLRNFALITWIALLLSAVIWGQIELPFLRHMIDDRAVALYSVGLSIAMIASRGGALLSSALMPHFAFQKGRQDMEKASKVYFSATKYMALIVLPMCLGIAAVAKPVIILMFGQQFADAAPNTAIVVAAAALGSSTASSAAVYGMEKQAMVMWAGFLGVILMPLLCFLLVPNWGLVGAASARLITQLVMVGIGVAYVVFNLRLRFPATAYIRTFLASGAAALIAFWFSNRLGLVWGLFTGIVAAIFAYLVLVRILRILDQKDKEQLSGVLDRMPRTLGRLLNILFSGNIKQ